jgi:hypothetical protein
MDANLKLYVWDHVLSDYTDGIMFSLATSVEEAKDLILSEIRGGCDGLLDQAQHDLDRHEPTIYESRSGFWYQGEYQERY